MSCCIQRALKGMLSTIYPATACGSQPAWAGLQNTRFAEAVSGYASRYSRWHRTPEVRSGSDGLLMPERSCGLLRLAPSGRGTGSRSPTPDCGATVLPDPTLQPRPQPCRCRCDTYGSARVRPASVHRRPAGRPPAPASLALDVRLADHASIFGVLLADMGGKFRRLLADRS